MTRVPASIMNSFEGLRKPQRERIAHAIGLLIERGYLNRGDIVRHGEVSVPQASADIAAIKSLAPTLMRYDTALKSYVLIDPPNPAVERGMAQLDAQADLYCERIGWATIVGNLGLGIETMIGRDRLAGDRTLRSLVRRHTELIDRWVRQAYAEGFLEGGTSRKQHDARNAG